MGYKHFTISERENLMLWISQGFSISEMAKNLGRNKSSILREINRNSNNGNYLAYEAQNNYFNNRKKSKKHKILEDDSLRDFIADKILTQQWSAEQIAQRAKVELGFSSISFMTIYRGIYNGIFDKYRDKYGRLKASVKLRHRGK